MTSSFPIPRARFPDGAYVPRLGLGTWRMGEVRGERAREIAALREGIAMGMTLIDTAEMYGEGGAEQVVADAIADCRDGVFLVSKFYPHHASRSALIRACEDSLRRLRTDRLDLYLLHWRGQVPLAETVQALQHLVADGKILRWGVSNFDVADLEEAERAGGDGQVASDQVLYNLSRRGIEWDLLPWCAARQIPVMAYSPIDQGRLASDPELEKIARRHGVTASQVALAWLLSKPGIAAIPKASSPEHVRENRMAAQLELDPRSMKALDNAFRPPRGKVPLEMI